MLDGLITNVNPRIMKITVPNFKKAPEWVRIINLLNLFMAGIAVGQILAVGYDTLFVMTYFIIGPLVTLILDAYFIPKKEVDFPGEYIQHLKDQFPAL